MMRRLKQWRKPAVDHGGGSSAVPAAAAAAVLQPPNSTGRAPFPSGIKNLYNPEGSAIADIVLVHGITGDRERTWTAPGIQQSWPETLLPLRFPNARVLTFGYDAQVADWRGVVSENRIADHAGNLLTALAHYRENDGTNDRPLIFVCHSLGGLVCEDALVIAKLRPEPDFQRILRSTAGIVFLGTPHHGVAVAQWAERLAKSIGVVKQTNSNILEVLRRDSEVLARIQDSFHTLVMARRSEGLRPVHIYCFFEELPMQGIGTVVPKESAKLPGYSVPIGIRANHVGMVQFATADDPGFVAVCGELSRCMREINAERTEAAQKTASAAAQGTTRLQDERDTQTLNPNVPADRDLLYQRFLASLSTEPVVQDDSKGAQGRLFSELILWKRHAQGPWNYWLRDYIKADLSVNVRDYDGQTPLHHALLTQFEREEKVHALVEAGADVTMKNYAEQTPVELAKTVDDRLFSFLLLAWRRSLLIQS